MSNEYRTNNCGELNIGNVGKNVKLAGWIQRIRNLGGMTFIDLRDQYGITQIVVSDDEAIQKQLDGVYTETVIQVNGKVVERSNKNTKIPTGEIEVIADKIEILGKCKSTLPFEINSEKADIDLVKDRLTAFQTFIKHGISFKCHGVKLHSPYPNNKRIDALEDGMPWNKSNHGDERYVLYRIRPEKIIEVRVPVEYLDQDIRNMNYLYNSLNIDIIKNRINYYLKKTKLSGNQDIVDTFNVLIQKYENVLNLYLYSTPEKRRTMDLPSMLDPILKEISETIGRCMVMYYGKLIHFDDYICVRDVVLYEIENNRRFETEIMYGHDFMHIMLHSPQAKMDKPKEKVIH